MIGKDSLPFTTVKIGRIKNTTSEPKLEDLFYKALAEEFLKRGITVTDSAQNTIEGEINSFQLGIAAEKTGYATDYNITMGGNFVLKSRDGKKKEFKGVKSPFYESVTSLDTVNEVVAAKELAAAGAVKRLAASLVFELMMSE
ncbi:LPS assembly lipoprotein LptE [Candidatus Magnetomonas plexicatena]|uniref:LPS assembly lipoprotein LptE n=1 Tax=Candidatus Magnetomonas plexicatena TaxID=2552947 RepID=UPI001C779DD4|nr:hypothetical protein E2O03_006720 [Nitrospirales bacterium LBB_01]